MVKNAQHSISDLVNELKVFNRNDVLVNLKESECLLTSVTESAFSLPKTHELDRIFKKSQLIFKESGAAVFCISNGVLEWEWKGTTCQSPVILCPAQIRLDKIKQIYHISFDPEEAFLNPFLKISFQKEFDFEWSDLLFFQANWEELDTQFKQKGFAFSFHALFHVGNFHHHRYHVLRDVESLETKHDFSPALAELLHLQAPNSCENIQLTNQLLFAADNDQQRVFSKGSEANLVVQGPPGTGKSQVLSNFIAKLLHHQKKTLVVSEKRVALEVLEKKLAQFQLGQFAFLPGTDSPSSSFLDQLKKTWLFLESYAKKQPFQLQLSKQKLDNLQFKLNLLSKKDLIGGLSFSNYQARVKGLNLLETAYNSASASIAAFDENADFLQLIYQKNLNPSLALLPKSMIANDSFLSLDASILGLEKSFLGLRAAIELDTPSELSEWMKKASFAQLLANEVEKDYFKTLRPNSVEQKKFKKLSKVYFLLKKELDLLSDEKKNWKEEPSKTETNALLKSFEKRNFFEKIKLKRRMSQLLQSSFVPAKDALVQWLKLLERQEELGGIEKQLLEIGISDETEIVWVKDLSRRIEAEEFKIWEKESKEANRRLANCNQEIYAFYHAVRAILQIEENGSISAAIAQLKNDFPALIVHQKALQKLPEALHKQMSRHAFIDSLEKEILKSAWYSFIGHFPAFADFDADKLNVDLDEIIRLQEQEASDFAEEITLRIKANFDAHFALLNTTSRKLSPEEKERKARLKKGRSLLVKEFSKTRSHPSLRELLNSEAAEWIYTLIPIWMVSPAQVADFFPLEKETFEYALFDEATQIPLVNSLGALYRSKRTIVVGDEQQMTPTHFFQSGESEPLDLLHQARFTWEKVRLKHHYRSEHPALIAFSNEHFYENQLIAYPSANGHNSAIQTHFVPDGKFVERENVKEAQALAKLLEKQLLQTDSLGVVAFSETQLSCIFKSLSSKSQVILEERIEQNTCFFRALENIQGDECGHLLISLGYAPNEEDKLLLNFGPLNRKSGRRRLNVLLTRAKKKIDFFTSIQAEDLALSDNDSLNLLRQFLQSAENQASNPAVVFPHQLDFKIEAAANREKQAVIFENFAQEIANANEFLTLHRVLTARNWEPKYS
ncbi:MAG: AAA domain-containing protein [Crocinitomicaceae bacterium]